MIRVALLRSESATVYIDFDSVPLEREADFRCIPKGEISFESAEQIALELHQGRLTGRLGGQAWYRQAGS